jgi:hypothetical protein
VTQEKLPTYDGSHRTIIHPVGLVDDVARLDPGERHALLECLVHIAEDDHKRFLHQLMDRL